VEDNLYEVVDILRNESVVKLLSSYRVGFFSVINNQEIILLGGYNSSARDQWMIDSHSIDFSTEIFTESISPFIGLPTERSNTVCTTNQNDLVCVGGFHDLSYLSEIRIFDLNTKTAVGGTNLLAGKIAFNSLIKDDQHLVFVGGLGQAGYLKTIDSFNTKSFLNISSEAMVYPRANHSATILNDGRVLIIGGGPTLETSTSAEILDLTTGESEELPWRMRVSRAGHTATLLPDGRVLVVGGSMGDKTMEVFNPPSGL